MPHNNRIIDKDFCMSSYLVYRYVENENILFYDRMEHKNFSPIPLEKRIKIFTSDDIEYEIKKVFRELENEKLGIMLSGGMDSAILASFMPGRDAYTLRFENNFYNEELIRAELYAKKGGLKLHYVDIRWEDFLEFTPKVMARKGTPVHSIEPQIYKAALQAQSDGITKMIVGESSDLIFGGMDLLLSKDWSFDDFVTRYTFTDPRLVLKKPVDVNYLFEKYKKDDKIDLLPFMDNVFSIESSGSYFNAFGTAGLSYHDPYAHLVMGIPLDINRVRNGESKYLIRGLFAKIYPDIKIPNKIPMPRQVDKYLADWKGPQRSEFNSLIDISNLSGNQKWQIYCLEKFLNINES